MGVVYTLIGSAIFFFAFLSIGSIELKHLFIMFVAFFTFVATRYVNHFLGLGYWFVVAGILVLNPLIVYVLTFIFSSDPTSMGMAMFVYVFAAAYILAAAVAGWVAVKLYYFFKKHS